MDTNPTLDEVTYFVHRHLSQETLDRIVKGLIKAEDKEQISSLVKNKFGLVSK